VRTEHAAIYRLYAANCVELAAQLNDAERRLFLLRMATAWSDLANRVENNGHVASEFKSLLVDRSDAAADGED
jgi:hypothetical protein